MPDISLAINFNKKDRELIERKSKDPLFSYQNWGDEDLKDLRKVIRDYYRDEQKSCTYCRKDISIQSASNSHVEHLIPKSKALNFIFEPKNLCVVCSDCNDIKKEKEVLSAVDNTIKRKKEYKRYPTSTNAYLIYHPHFDKYEDHIFKCGDIYIDCSPKGSYTMMICKLNRKAHKYGIEPTLLSQSELFDLMNQITTEQNFTKRYVLMNKIREYFISIG